MMIGANLRFGNSGIHNGTKIFQCHVNSSSEAFLLLTIALLGIVTNIAIMGLIIGKASLRRWCHGLIFHQAAIDCTRATMLLPLAFSLHFCRPIYQCNIFETVFLLLATVSAVNLLTTVLNDTPLMPDDDGIDMDWLVESPQVNHWPGSDNKESLDVSANVGARLLDAPHCVLFGISMIWFAAITVNLGPTFITGALANHVESTPSAPSCTLIQTPYRHYIVNLLWVLVNSLCLALTAAHLYRLHRDLVRPKSHAVRVAGLVSTILGQPPPEEDKGNTIHQLIRRLEAEGIRRIRMFTTICVVYGLFWGPLFSVIVFGGGSTTGEGRSLASSGPPKDPASHQVMLYICFAHAFVNPTLFLLLHNGLKEAAAQVFCCSKSLMPACGHIPSYSTANDCNVVATSTVGYLSNNIDYARMNHFNGPRSFLPPPPSSPLRTVDSQTQSHMETVI